MRNTPPRVDLSGMRFGALVASAWIRPEGSQHGKWQCRCDCGSQHLVRTRHLRSGEVQSCGCLTRTLIGAAGRSHGLSHTSIYSVWLSMRERCINPCNKAYKNYGRRGIKVCESWNVFENFMADMGPRPPGLTLERRDNNGNYEPGNCHWADRKSQARNKRNNRLIEHNGEILCLAEWAERLGLPQSHIQRRMSVQGMSFADAISTPKRYAVWRRARMEQARGIA